MMILMWIVGLTFIVAGCGAFDRSAQDAAVSSELPPVQISENDAFRVFAPAANGTVGDSFTVKGEANVQAASFSYAFEDGHNELASGIVPVEGGDGWRPFSFTVQFSDPSSPVGTLSLFVEDAQAGTFEHLLNVPLTFQSSLLK
jgi:hypothetical protein